MRSALRAFYVIIMCASLLAIVLSLSIGEFKLRYVTAFFIFLSLLYSDKAKEKKEAEEEQGIEKKIPRVQVKECAKCGLVNSDSAATCDCGYRL